MVPMLRARMEARGVAKEHIGNLIAQLYSGKVDRRDFVKRATAAGLSAALAGQVVGRFSQVSAQDGTAVAGEKATDIGAAGHSHMTDTSKGMIKVYSSWPLTGSYDVLGNDAVAAVRMAFEDFGMAAGGFAIEYEALDDGSAANNGGPDAAKETENVNRVVSDSDAMVYLATYNSGMAKISIPITNAAQPGPLAQISYANTYPGLTKAIADGGTEEGEPDVYYPTGIRNYMRTCPADDIQGAAGANWAFSEQGRTKAYVLHDKSLYGQGVAKVFELSFKALGGEILGFEGYTPGDGNYVSLVTKIADMGPDIVYVGATVDNNPSKLLQDVRSVMSTDDVIYLGSDGQINQRFIDGAGEAAEGAYVTFAGLPPNELKGPGKDYLDRIQTILGHLPDAYAVYGYECAVVVIQAIDRVGEKDRAKILDAMWNTTEFRSLLGGQWSFTDTGDTDATIMSVSKIENASFVWQKDIAPATT